MGNPLEKEREAAEGQDQIWRGYGGVVCCEVEMERRRMKIKQTSALFVFFPFCPDGIVIHGITRNLNIYYAYHWWIFMLHRYGVPVLRRIAAEVNKQRLYRIGSSPSPL